MLPNSTIVSQFLSDDEEVQQNVSRLLEEFLLIAPGEKMTLPELSTLAFGDKYPDNYQRTRYFVQGLNKSLQDQNKDMVEQGLAFIYNEGQEVKKDCEKIGKTYRTGGAYQFTRKMLGLILLAKSSKFREYVRTTYNQEGEKQYVPHNLTRKHTNIRRYVIAHAD